MDTEQTERKPAPFTATADEIRLQGLAAKPNERPQLSGVHFDPENRLAVATDGHALAVRRSSELAPHGRTVNFSGVKITKTRDAYSFSPTSPTTAAEDGRAGFAELLPEGLPFAQYTIVTGGFRNRTADIRVCVDAYLLDRLVKALTGNRRQGYAVLSIDPQNLKAPIGVIVEGEPDAVGVIMPYNYNERDDPAARLRELAAAG